jgi:hypothetical protein
MAKFFGMMKNVPIADDKGIRIACHWQTKSFYEVPLSWTLCVINDIGEITETMLPEHRLSKTGAIQIQKHKKAGTISMLLLLFINILLLFVAFFTLSLFSSVALLLFKPGPSSVLTM